MLFSAMIGLERNIQIIIYRFVPRNSLCYESPSPTYEEQNQTMIALKRHTIVAERLSLFIYHLFFNRINIIIIFLILLPQLVIAQNITTIAGNGTGGYNGDGNA